MIEKQTVVDQVEVLRDGTIQIRLGLLLVEDGQQLNCQWHRTSLPPGTSLDDQIAAVNTNLTAMGFEAVDLTTQTVDLPSLVAAVQTPDVIAAYAAAQASEGES